ncbi:hypothetical protein GCM10007938_31720 [Vibrio zhanjiangensis]|uniref:Uncharacterized protein n=1 Tax=Vibrio zhanjiangensis TaxID=1046128 RepID=A0ABQ6F1R2_9VIBR|nr:Ig-like domain-containing protein [Vibrio zhanjiangensis]GLT19390.1 hypothetical protein GCM10007938_31720 [Vibrio zhanjiangensis]
MGVGLSVAGNTMSVAERVIINGDGHARIVKDDLRELTPGDLVLTNSQVNSVNSLSVGLVDENADIQDITEDVDQIINTVEKGQDPAGLGDEFTTAAGSQLSSSISSMGTIEPLAGEPRPSTNFDTQGLLSELGLSETQSLTLFEQYRAFQQSPTLTDLNDSPLADNLFVVTDEDNPVSGQVFATDPNSQDILSFVITSGPANGVVSIDSSTGVWIYTPNFNFDGADSFEITVDDGNGGTDTATVNLQVTPIPEISLVGPSVVNEGDSAVYVATFDKPSTQGTQINLSLSTPSAESGDLSSMIVTTPDGLILIVSPDGTVNVPAGVTSLNISVGTTDDNVFESSENFQLDLTSGFGTVGGGELTTTIQDNDIPILTVSSENVVEGGIAVFDIELSNQVDGDVTYEFSLSLDANSAEQEDFVLNSMTVNYEVDGVGYTAAANSDGSYTLPGNANNIQVSLPTFNDTIFEGLETFNLDVRATATVGDNSFDLTDSGTGTITDDRDGMNNADTPHLTVSSETVVEGGVVSFDIELSNQVDGDVTYEFSLNVDGHSAEWEDFVLNPMTVSYEVEGVDYTAAVNSDGSYTLPGNASNIQVSLQTVNDSIFEGSETFTLTAKAKATVGGNSFNVTNSGEGTISDDRDGINNADTPHLTVSSEAVVEGESVVFDIELSNQVDGDVTYEFSLNVDGHSAEWEDFVLNPMTVSYEVEGVDYTAAVNSDGSYTLPGNASNIQVSIQTASDGCFEGTETFSLDVRASAVVGGDSFDLTDSGLGTIEDIDIPLVSISEGNNIGEGLSSEFMVSLSKNTDKPVIVNLSLAHIETNADDITQMEVAYQDSQGWQTLSLGENGDLVVPAGITQLRVTVQTADDNTHPVYEGAERFELIVTGVDGAKGHDSSISTIIDDGSLGLDDDRPVVTHISEVTVAEADDAVFHVELSSESTTDTHVILELKERKASSPEDFDGSTVTILYGDPEQTETVSIQNGLFEFDLPSGESHFSVVVKTVDDDVSENNETFLLAVKTEYQSGEVSAKATIEDNEKPIIDLDGSQYQIEFVSEDAGYRNVFGYYVYDPESDTQQLQILMSDSHDSRQDGFDPVLATLGNLDNVEYFLIADGAHLVERAPVGARFEVDNDGRLIINGNLHSHVQVLLSHDEASLMRTSVNENGDTIINFDDQVNIAHDDNDYDDLVIKIAKQDTNVDYSTEFTEGTGSISIVDTDVDIFDDKDSILSMQVLLTTAYEGDRLTWTPMSGFSVTQINTATGLGLLITTNDPNGVSAAEFETFLKGIQYENTSIGPDETERSVELYVTDSYGQRSETATTTIAVNKVNDIHSYKFTTGSHGDDVITGSDEHDIMVGDVQGIQIIAGQDYNLAFVLDTSGSMGDSVENAKSEILQVFDQLHSTVNSGANAGKVNMLLSEFSTNTGVTISVDLNSPSARSDFITQLDKIENKGDGYTNYEASFDAVVEWFNASTNTQAENITYFITDGYPNYIQKSKVGESQFDELVLDYDALSKHVVTLRDVLPLDYTFGTSVTYKGQEIVSSSGIVISPLTGAGLGKLTDSNGLEYSDINSITTQTRHAYQVLALVSSVEAIGIGDGINAATLSQYDTDAVVAPNIDVDALAETILGQEVPLQQGEDRISGGIGNDILFGDLINFEHIDGQGVSALQKYVAIETNSPLTDISAKDVNHFIVQNYDDFDISHHGDRNDMMSGAEGDDILFGQGGNDTLDGGIGSDILLGGSGDDILIGGSGNDILSGGIGYDQFVWRNQDLDQGTDVVSDFRVSEDKINLSDLLVGGESMEDLLSDISASVDNNTIELVIEREGGQCSQSIQLENVVDQLIGMDISGGSITGHDLSNLLHELILVNE